ncbi:MAG: outer membrane beta-barrel protein [Pseudomonadota bacterium]
MNGLEYGVVAGYSAVNGRIFGGVEAEFSLSSAEVDFDDPLLGAATLSVTYSYGASLMAGYTLAPASLVYGKIGAIFTEFEADALGQTDTDTASGITFGTGSEVAIGRGFSLRGEVENRFLELDDTDVDSLGIDFALIRRF